MDRKIDDYSYRIVAAIKESATTVTRVHGVEPFNAAVIFGEVGDASRFASGDQFARYSGTAPIPASSSDHQRHRLNRAGNRRLNHALHIAVITQIRQNTLGRELCRRKMAEFKSHKEAVRVLKRRISDAV